MNEYYVFDLEADNLLDEVTRIHCLSVTYVHSGGLHRFSTSDYEAIKQFFLAPNRILVGHNIIRYDRPVVEKILGIRVPDSCKYLDTLAFSWYLYPNRLRHGLESWGNDLGVPKPVIDDWENLSLKDYIHRCETDVEINLKLFYKQLDYLNRLYENDENQVKRIMGYLSYKLECAREQEEIKWKLDIPRATKALKELTILKEKKVEALSDVMPEKIEYKEFKKPSKLHKKDGNLTVAGVKWFQLLDDNKLPLDYGETLTIEKSRKKGSPTSHYQLKDWLFSMGWVPETFKTSMTPLASEGEKRQKQLEKCQEDVEKGYLKSFKIKNNKIEKESVQTSLPMGGGICDSVKKLYNVCPKLQELEDLYMITHRIGIFKGFLENVDQNGLLQAQVKGFTNTLRFQHTVLVNLPAVYKPYSEDIRGSLIAPTANHVLCGSDMSSLEDTTKQHYMYFFDPDYVMEMRTPGFDPHLDIGVQAKLVTPEDSDFHKWYEKTKEENKDYVFTDEENERYNKVSKQRKSAKPVNFGGVYGAGPAKLAKTLGCTLEFATELHRVYWERNKAVKQVAKSVRTKTIGTDMWLFNPVSKFWYSLRYEKDKFSTLNQGTGVYCFDSWVRRVRGKSIKVCGQFHDEIITPLLKGNEDKVKETLLTSIDEVNEELQLNVELGISVDFGPTYADIH